VGAESALPCTTAICGILARIGVSGFGEAGLIRRSLRVFRFFGGMGTSFTPNNRRGTRFQPCRVNIQPVFRNPPWVMLLGQQGRLAAIYLAPAPCFTKKAKLIWDSLSRISSARGENESVGQSAPSSRRLGIS